MLIKAERHKDGKIFTSDMSSDNKYRILEIHFLESAIQVLVEDVEKDYISSFLINGTEHFGSSLKYDQGSFVV